LISERLKRIIKEVINNKNNNIPVQSLTNIEDLNVLTAIWFDFIY
jgi:hypothetical protein